MTKKTSKKSKPSRTITERVESESTEAGGSVSIREPHLEANFCECGCITVHMTDGYAEAYIGFSDSASFVAFKHKLEAMPTSHTTKFDTDSGTGGTDV